MAKHSLKKKITVSGNKKSAEEQSLDRQIFF